MITERTPFWLKTVIMCPQNKQANFFIYVQFNEKHSDLLSVHAAPTKASRTKSLFTIGLICPVINPQDSSKAIHVSS